MGLFDSVLGSLTGSNSAGQTSNAANPLLGIVVGMLTHQSGGGLAGVVQQFVAKGLGQQANSWVGNGPNEPITADHIHQVFGTDQVQQMAQQTGLPPQHVAAGLAQLLPQIINQLTPNGSMVHGDELKNNIAGLLKGLL